MITVSTFDLEGLITGHSRFFGVNFLHFCITRSGITPFNEFIDVVFLPFGLHQYGTIVHISHEPGKVKFVRHGLGIEAIAYALNFAFYDYTVIADQGFIIW